MKTRIYVGNIAYNARANRHSPDVRAVRGEIGAADVFTAGKKRFAFVLMMNESDAESAIGGLNGSEFFGRELLVQWTAKQRSVRSDDFMPNREPSPHDRTWYNALVNRVL